jgi:hypothetical protein
MFLLGVLALEICEEFQMPAVISGAEDDILAPVAALQDVVRIAGQNSPWNARHTVPTRTVL